MQFKPKAEIPNLQVYPNLVNPAEIFAGAGFAKMAGYRICQISSAEIQCIPG